MKHAGWRAGSTVVEAVIALALGLLVVHLGLSALQRAYFARGRVVDRIDALAAYRVARFVPRREVRFGLGARDWSVAGDSLSLRAFRGTGIVCPNEPPEHELVVSFRGDRLPDPAKDSVLLVRAGGGHVVAALKGLFSTVAACGVGPTTATVWRVEPAAPPDVVLARLFERGSYHLADAALRYRRGASGRQPLTPEVWSSPQTRWVRSDDRVGFEYVPIARPHRGWTGFLAWSGRP